MDARARVALTIAGSDSSGGAGIQADLKTFAAFQVYGACAITALTAQNTRGVFGVDATPPDFVSAQIARVLEDLPVDAAKTGMLGTVENVRAVADAARAHGFPLVVDPVLVATSGDALAADGVKDALLELLVPLAAVVTPNAPEASALVGARVATVDDLVAAGRALVARGARAALVKGGHLSGARVVDALVTADDVTMLEARRLDTTSTHGTGCTLSAAIAAGLARGAPLVDAVRAAHAYVHTAIARAPGLGKGHGPLHHLHPYYALPRGGPSGASAPTDDDDARFMRAALALAREAERAGEVPIGAVVVENGEIVGRGRNAREGARDPVAHAELRAIVDAASTLGRWRLSGTTLYVTLEPCFMCAGALVNARVDRLVFAARDPKAGAQGSLACVATDPRLNHRLDVTEGVLADECGALLRAFFHARRA